MAIREIKFNLGDNWLGFAITDTPGDMSYCSLWAYDHGRYTHLATSSAKLHQKENSNLRTAVLTTLKRALEFALFTRSISSLERRFIWHEIRRQLWEENSKMSLPEPELKPCPWCGSHYVGLNTSAKLGISWYYCPECPGTSGGPKANTPAEAREKWNTRHG